jgi:hypothetical protein
MDPSSLPLSMLLSISRFLLFEGVVFEEEDEREWVECMCEWDGSVMEMEDCEGRMEELGIKNSSKTGLKLTEENVKIVYGKSENNNTRYNLLPSFSWDILCDGSGELTIENLKGGDRLLPNSSLWIVNSSECVLKGITEERTSSFFIPTITHVTSENGYFNSTLPFAGTHFFPCSLNYTVRNESSVEGKIPSQAHFNFTSFTNETRREGNIPKSMVDSTTWDIEVSIFINFPSHKTTPHHRVLTSL